MAVFQVLERKGLLTSSEVSEAIESIALRPPATLDMESQQLQRQLRERLRVRLQELVLHFGATGAAQ